MKVSRIVVGLSIAVLCACAQTSASWVEEAPSVEDDVARSVEWMDIAPEKIGDPELLCTAGDYLLWVDNDMDRPLSVLYLPTGEISAPLRKGRAGGEVLDIQQILRDVDTVGRFAAVDGFKHRIVCLSADRGTLSREGEYPIDALFDRDAVRRFRRRSLARRLGTIRDRIVGRIVDGRVGRLFDFRFDE